MDNHSMRNRPIPMNADEERLLLVNSLSQAYDFLFYINAKYDYFVTYSSTLPDDVIPVRGCYSRTIHLLFEKLSQPEFVDRLRIMTDLSTLDERFENETVLRERFIGAISKKWLEISMLVSKRDYNGEIEAITLSVRDVTDLVRHEQEQMEKLQEAYDREAQANLSLQHQLSIIHTMNKVYFTAHYINLVDNSYIELTTWDNIRKTIQSSNNVRIAIQLMLDHLIHPDFVEGMTQFMDLDTIEERLSDKQYVSHKYIGATSGWSQAMLIAGDRDENGKLLSIIYASRMIHEEMELQEKQDRAIEQALQEAKAASEAKTSFLFNMSHDIRTPMNAIIGFRNLLEHNIDNPEKRIDYLNKIETSSNVLLGIINNVLEMARIEKGSVKLEETAWNVEQFNTTVFTVCNDMMSRKGIEFVTETDVQHHYAYIDSTKLREILINLLSNAYKYTNNGGRVSMSLKELESPREGYVLFQTTISDTGIGISKEFLPHVFEEFSRERNTTENKIMGTGLGTHIVKRLVELMQGTITVESEVGVGTTFVITLPHRIADPSTMVNYQGVKIDPKIIKGKRVLLVEDNELNAEIATEILLEAGFIVENADDGQTAIEMVDKAATNYYDIILMDIQMPRMNGYDATRYIRSMQSHAKANIPILAMTANAFEEDRAKSLEAGMNGHLAKPINIPELMLNITHLLSL